MRQRAAASGFRLAYHNHDFEFVTLDDGSRLMDVLLAAEPALLWEADVGWLIRAGEDSLAWLDRYADRSDDARRRAYDRYLHPDTRVPLGVVLADHPDAADDPQG